MRPILCSTLVITAPLRSPSSPVSRSTMWNLGTTKSDRPLVPGPAPSGRASTKWTMLSDRSVSAEVMNRLTPVMFQVPSALLDRLGASRADVGAGVRLGEDHRRGPLLVDHELGELLLLVGAEDVAGAWRRRSSTRYMPTAGFAPRISSLTAQRSDGGTTVPPSSAGTSTAQNPDVEVGRVRLLERLGQRHGVRHRVVDRRVAVGVEQALGELVLGEPGRPRAASPARCRCRRPRKDPCPSTSPRPKTSNSANSRSRTLLR